MKYLALNNNQTRHLEICGCCSNNRGRFTLILSSKKRLNTVVKFHLQDLKTADANEDGGKKEIVTKEQKLMRDKARMKREKGKPKQRS